MKKNLGYVGSVEGDGSVEEPEAGCEEIVLASGTPETSVSVLCTGMKASKSISWAVS
jgi:hypothetical protein